ncbi:MAG TPA: type II toxin-antitoxin system Phd/YefM family antitoxin [Actinomycetales bacterium]|nr:type II toxin-antitoxin system Phd/YefM family antitoxin [Actinomycetales bacterium]
MTTVSVTEARSSLLDVLNRVEGGEEVTITRHGRPVAVVVRPGALRPRRVGDALADADRVRDLLATARSAPRPAGRLTAARADELVRGVRGGRRRR